MDKLSDVATVLTVYGIETFTFEYAVFITEQVATVLTVYGIETIIKVLKLFFKLFMLLQQYLPFTVLKPGKGSDRTHDRITLQQYLPFTVLKLMKTCDLRKLLEAVATVLTVYGIETNVRTIKEIAHTIKLQQYLPFTVLKHYVLPRQEQRTGYRCNSTYRLRY